MMLNPTKRKNFHPISVLWTWQKLLNIDNKGQKNESKYSWIMYDLENCEQLIIIFFRKTIRWLKNDEKDNSVAPYSKTRNFRIHRCASSFLEEPPAFTQHICHEHHNGWLCKIISLVKDFPIGMLYTQCKILHTQSCVARQLVVANLHTFKCQIFWPQIV